MVGIFHSIVGSDIAKWPTPNYKNPIERTWLPAYAIPWEIVTTAFVIGRLYARGRRGTGIFRSYGADDAAIVVGWAFSIAVTVSGCVSVWVFQIGRHIWDMEPKNYSRALYAGWLAQLFFILSTGGTKLSVFLFYRRLLKGTESKNWQYVNWFLLCITAGIWISGFVTECFMCIPLHAFWDYVYMKPNEYRCLNGDALTIATAVLTIGSDFWTAALPCALMQVYDLGLTKWQKIALNGVFCLGFIVTGIGGVRTYYLWEIGKHGDLSWIGYNLYLTAIAECQISIICTCAPFCRAVFRRHVPGGSQRLKDGDDTTGRTLSTTGHRASTFMSGGKKGVSAGTSATSDEDQRLSKWDIELCDVEMHSDIGDPQSCTLAKDEKTGRIIMQPQAVTEIPLENRSGHSRSRPSR